MSESKLPTYILQLAQQLGIRPGTRREPEPDAQPVELESQAARRRMLQSTKPKPAGGHEKDQA